MKFTNLYEGYNKTEDFRILICAFDRNDAQELADGYCLESDLEGSFEIGDVGSIDETHYDCDYVISLDPQ